MEAIQAHYITTSAQSGFSITLLAPDANWTGALVAGATDAKIALWARHGTLQSAITSFTPSYTGTAQILISGLAAGTYTVTVGGAAVAGSPFTVSAGDNSVYFEAAAGAIQISGGGVGSVGSGNNTGAPVLLPLPTEPTPPPLIWIAPAAASKYTELSPALTVNGDPATAAPPTVTVY